MATDDNSPVSGTGADYRTRSIDRLRADVDGNIAGTIIHDYSLAELERREASEARKVELRWIKLTLAATVALGMLGIAATFVSG